MLTKVGAKLLDFGLAKPRNQAIVSGQTETTLDQPLTAHGTILGTLQYMAPEQLEGHEADARTDIFAFGCVLYEMLTATRAFDGASSATVVGKILHSDPASLVEMEPSTPPLLEAVIRACFAKQPEQRFESAADLRRVLQWIASAQITHSSDTATKSRLSRTLAAGVGTVLVLGSVVFGSLKWVSNRNRHSFADPLSTSVLPPVGTVLPDVSSAEADWETLAISPDGRSILLSAMGADDISTLWVYDLRSGSYRRIEGTNNAGPGFWSPDSKEIGFFTDDGIFRVQASGGTAERVCELRDAVRPLAASWAPSGLIYVARYGQSGIWEVRPETGTVSQALPNVAEDAEMPVVMSDSKHLIFTRHLKNGETQVELGVIGEQSVTTLIRNAFGVAIHNSTLMYWRRPHTLLAQGLDLKNRTMVGDPVEIARRVFNLSQGVSVSDTGVLVYRPLPRDETQITSFDRLGRQIGTLLEPRVYNSWNISPDGTQLAFSAGPPEQDGELDIWLANIQSGNVRRLTSDRGREIIPVWSPDSGSVAYTWSRGVDWRFDSLNTSTGARQTLASGKNRRIILERWSRDGRFLIYQQYEPDHARVGEFALDLQNDRRALRVVRSEFELVAGADISADGQWTAFLGKRNGRVAVYVEPFPPDGRLWQVASSGDYCEWSPKGRTLFIADGNRILEISKWAPETSSPPVALFEKDFNINGFYVTPDATRFILPVPVESLQRGRLHVVFNWQQLLN